jgi:hypothetical protein
MQIFTQGTIWHSVYRGVMAFVVFALTAVLTQHPEWGTATIGGIAFAVVHYLEAKLQSK